MFFMINDEKIDLTEENKFGRDRRSFDAIDVIVNNVTRFPWNYRRIETHEDMSSGKPSRTYGDTLSDEMGCVVRRCSDGNYFFGDVSLQDKPWFWNLFEEVLMEVGLLSSSFNTCPCCGKRMITPRVFTTCNDCDLDRHATDTMNKLFPKISNRSYISWEHSENVVGFDENFNRTLHWSIPQRDLQALRK